MELLHRAVMQLEQLMQQARRADDTNQYVTLRSAQQSILNQLLGGPLSALQDRVGDEGDVKVRIRPN